MFKDKTAENLGGANGADRLETDAASLQMS